MRGFLLLLALPLLTHCQSADKAQLPSAVIRHHDLKLGTHWHSQATFFTDDKLGGTFLLVKSYTMVKNQCESITQHYMWDPETEGFVAVDYPIGWPELGSQIKVVDKDQCKLRSQAPGPIDYT